MYDFEYVRPKTLADAVADVADDGAQPIGGGQTLIPTLKSRLASPSRLVSLSAIPELRGVSTAADGAIRVGGATPHAEVARDAAASFPALAGLAGKIGDPAVRNMGTIGGSLANNDPSACYPAAALASGATIATNRREISADDFFRGLFETALDEDEIITEVRFPVPDAADYQKFEQPASRFALVGVFVARSGGSVRVAVTGASESGVYRWREAEAALGESFSADSLAQLDVDADGMISDLHGPPRYRAHLVKVLTGRAVTAAGS